MLGVYNPVPTLVTIASRSESGPWFVQVRLPGGGVLDSGMTDAFGQVELGMLDVYGLSLDVLDTDVVDLPVFAGVDVNVFLP
jgi:hypothetical protein